MHVERNRGKLLPAFLALLARLGHTAANRQGELTYADAAGLSSELPSSTFRRRR